MLLAVLAVASTKALAHVLGYASASVQLGLAATVSALSVFVVDASRHIPEENKQAPQCQQRTKSSSYSKTE
jgi:hypothetical protein